MEVSSTLSWEPLQNLKGSNPIEISEYVIAKGLDTEPAFAWWVPHTMKHRNRMIGALRAVTYKKK